MKEGGILSVNYEWDVYPHPTPENPSVVPDVHLRPKHAQGPGFMLPGEPLAICLGNFYMNFSLSSHSFAL